MFLESGKNLENFKETYVYITDFEACEALILQFFGLKPNFLNGIDSNFVRGPNTLLKAC